MLDLTKVKNDIRNICNSKDVECILFGSFIYGKPHFLSDLDIALIGNVDDVLEVEYLLNEEVDSPLKFDIIHLTADIKEGNPILYKEIIENGEKL